MKITYNKKTGNFDIKISVPRLQRGTYTYDEDMEYEVDNVCVFIDEKSADYGLFKTQYLDYKDSLQATQPIVYFDSRKEAEDFAVKYKLMIEYLHQ